MRIRDATINELPPLKHEDIIANCSINDTTFKTEVNYGLLFAGCIMTDCNFEEIIIGRPKGPHSLVLDCLLDNCNIPKAYYDKCFIYDRESNEENLPVDTNLIGGVVLYNI